MKILNIKSFEKLDINPIDLITVNDIGKRQINKFVNSGIITKKDLQTFDIVKAYGSLYMLFKNDDISKLTYDYGMITDAEEGLFLYYDYTYHDRHVIWFKTYTDDLKAYTTFTHQRASGFDITDVWMYENIDEQKLPNTIIGYTESTLNSIIKEFNYKHITIKNNLF